MKLDRVIEDIENMVWEQKKFQDNINSIMVKYAEQTEKMKAIEKLSQTNASDIKSAFIRLLVVSLGIIGELLYIIFNMINAK